MIATTGAHGQLGSRIVQELSRRGSPFRAISRRAGGASIDHASFMRADFDDRQSLEHAFDGVTRLLIVSTPDPNALRIERQLRAIDAARAAGVEHAIYLSFLASDPEGPFPFAESHHATERALRDSGLAWTILRPSLYLDSLSMLAVEVRADGVVRAPAGQGRASLLSRDDVAAAAATVLVEPGRNGEVLSLTGTEAVSYPDVARLLSATTGRSVEYFDEDPERYRSRIASSMPPPMADAFVAIWRTIREGWLAPIHSGMASLGHTPTGVAAWLHENRAAFVE
jgi:NAD(P)H dehydrogenase (quinone)